MTCTWTWTWHRHDIDMTPTWHRPGKKPPTAGCPPMPCPSPPYCPPPLTPAPLRPFLLLPHSCCLPLPSSLLPPPISCTMSSPPDWGTLTLKGEKCILIINSMCLVVTQPWLTHRAASSHQIATQVREAVPIETCLIWKVKGGGGGIGKSSWWGTGGEGWYHLFLLP